MITDKCPNCGCIWGLEEMDWYECFACGYPDNDKEEDDLDDSGVFDDEDDSDDPNDSRNL